MGCPVLFGSELHFYEFLIDLSDFWFGLMFVKEVKRLIITSRNGYYVGVFINIFISTILSMY